VSSGEFCQFLASLSAAPARRRVVDLEDQLNG
jgi:hypothetical protein